MVWVPKRDPSLQAVQLYACTAVQLYRCTDVQLYSCKGVQMYRCTATNQTQSRHLEMPAQNGPAKPCSALIISMLIASQPLKCETDFFSRLILAASSVWELFGCKGVV